MKYRALLFDLFGTVVLISHEVPETRTAGRVRRPTMGWIEEELCQLLPDIPLTEFLRAMGKVTEDIIRDRPPEYYEVPSRERFRRALELVGYGGDEALSMAERLCSVHMQYLASRTEMPGSHADLLRELSGEWPIGLVSNFDHGPTAHAILRREGIADVFAATIISADVGRRKPHPSIFHEALRRLDVGPGEALFVGDSLEDDVLGAHAAGMDVAWINPKWTELSPEIGRPRYEIRNLLELRSLLGRP